MKCINATSLHRKSGQMGNRSRLPVKGNRIVEQENRDFVSCCVAHAASAVWGLGDGG